MVLTLEQVLFVVLTVSAVAAVTFLCITLVQIKKTAREAERTFVEIRSLTADLKRLEQKAGRQLDELGSTLQSARRAANVMSGTAHHMTSGAFGPAIRYWPLIFPLLRGGWRLWKKRKEKRYER